MRLHSQTSAHLHSLTISTISQLLYSQHAPSIIQYIPNNPHLSLSILPASTISYSYSQQAPSITQYIPHKHHPSLSIFPISTTSHSIGMLCLCCWQSFLQLQTCLISLASWTRQILGLRPIQVMLHLHQIAMSTYQISLTSHFPQMLCRKSLLSLLDLVIFSSSITSSLKPAPLP